MATEAEKLRDGYRYALVKLYEHDRDRKANGLPSLTEDEEGRLRDYLIRQHAIEGHISEAASARASAPRKKDDRQEAFRLWAAWQEKPSIYRNKQEYIADVISKCEVSPNTARDWFQFFMGYRLEGWLARFGEKYPPKITE